MILNKYASESPLWGREEGSVLLKNLHNQGNNEFLTMPELQQSCSNHL